MRKVFLNFFLLTFFTATVMACGSSRESGNNPTTANEPTETVTYGPENGSPEEPACPGPKWGADSVSNVKHFSFFRNYVKNGNLGEAYKYWTQVFKNAPKASLYIYVNGADILEHKIEEAEDDAVREAFIDTLMMLYDQRIDCFGKRGEVLGRKGVNLIQVKPGAYDQAYEFLDESIQLQGNNTSYTVPYVYMYTVAKKYEDNSLDLSAVLEKYNRVQEIMDYNISQNTQYRQSWERVKDASAKVVEPLIPCEDLVNYYRDQTEQNEPGIEELEGIVTSLSSKGCTDNNLFYQLSTRLFKERPNATAARELAKSELARNNNNKAIEYYQRAAEMEEDNAVKAEDYLAIANIYKDQKNCSAAREYANRAANTRSNWGKPYMLLGDLYVTCASNCGDSFKRKTVYWLAVDQYIKARNVDNSVSDEAGRRISTYSKYFPTQEEVFYNLGGDTEGTSYKVECWPNETTTVRTNN